MLALVLQQYPKRRVIPLTYRFPTRRKWEPHNSSRVCQALGVLDNHLILTATHDHTPNTNSAREYYNRENTLFAAVRRDDVHYAAGFTGKNTTTIDPEVILPHEQTKYLVWYGIHRPFLMYDKHHTVDLFFQLGWEKLLKLTHSCQRHGSIHCGQCHACWERVDAFDKLGRRDVAIYSDDYEAIVKTVRTQFAVKYPPKERKAS